MFKKKFLKRLTVANIWFIVDATGECVGTAKSFNEGRRLILTDFYKGASPLSIVRIKTLGTVIWNEEEEKK